MIRSYIRELEKANPVAARAYAKLERISGDASIRPTDAALSVLSPAERRAYLDVFADEEPALNRAQRRRSARSRQGRSGGR